MDDMSEFESMLETIHQRQKASNVSWIDKRDADTIQVQNSPLHGQGVYAKRTIPVNTPICSLSYPIINAIDNDFLKTTCYHCLTVTKGPLPIESYGHSAIDLKTCNGCLSARFCNRECQVKSWTAYHKFECKIFKPIKQKLLSATFRAVMRIVLLKDRDLLSEEQWDRIAALPSHDHLLSSRVKTEIAETATGIKNLTSSKMDAQEIRRLVLIFSFNATELPTSIYGGIGVMLDPLLAKFNHSCEPNLAMRRPQYTMTSGWMCSDSADGNRDVFAQIMPLREIKEGEELFNCYVAPTVSVAVRKAKLQEDYLFECNCPKCVSDTEVLAKVLKDNSSVKTQFESWVKSIGRNLSTIKDKPGSLRKAATEMDKIDQYIGYSAIYTTGDIPEMLMALVLKGLKGETMDIALINMLRIHFLVNPSRFVGRHNPTNIYTMFLLLDMLDALIPAVADSAENSRRRGNSLQNLKLRGFTEYGLLYWRRRICDDLRKRIEASAAKDLLVLIEKREKQLEFGSKKIKEVDNADAGKAFEKEVGVALKLNEAAWDSALK